MLLTLSRLTYIHSKDFLSENILFYSLRWNHKKNALNYLYLSSRPWFRCETEKFVVRWLEVGSRISLSGLYTKVSGPFKVGAESVESQHSDESILCLSYNHIKPIPRNYDHCPSHWCRWRLTMGYCHCTLHCALLSAIPQRGLILFTHVDRGPL